VNAKTTTFNHGFRQPIAVAGPARGLIEQARRLEAAGIAMAKMLPSELNSGWQLARLDSEALVLVTDSAARATRLRYARAPLLQAAEQCLGVRAKTLSIRLAQPQRKPQTKAPPRLSTAAAASLRQAAQGMEDGALRRALAKLARHAKTGS